MNLTKGETGSKHGKAIHKGFIEECVFVRQIQTVNTNSSMKTVRIAWPRLSQILLLWNGFWQSSIDALVIVDVKNRCNYTHSHIGDIKRGCLLDTAHSRHHLKSIDWSSKNSTTVFSLSLHAHRKRGRKHRESGDRVEMSSTSVLDSYLSSYW